MYQSDPARKNVYQPREGGREGGRKESKNERTGVREEGGKILELTNKTTDNIDQSRTRYLDRRIHPGPEVSSVPQESGREWCY